MPLCIICETEKPEAEFKSRNGRQGTECIACRDELKLRKRRDRTLVQAIIDAPGQELPAIRGGSEERLKQAIELRMEFYKSNALEALYDLAMMPISGANSATLQVKYLAACRLAGPAAEAGTGRADNPIQGVLDQLNESYHANAPRIREIRERTITLEDRLPINGAAIDSGAGLPQ